MSKWSGDELQKLGDAEEVRLSSAGSDHKLGKPVTIWVARHGDDLYVRCVGGRTGRWFRGTQESHEGRVTAHGIHKDVTFADAGDSADEIDAVYRSKYHRYAGAVLDSVLTPAARSAT